MADSEDTIGERLRRAMRDAGITQKKLADLIGTTQPAVSQWTLGTKNPTPENLGVIADQLDVRAEWLGTGTGAMKAVRKRDVAVQRREFLDRTGWRFRAAPNDGGRDYGNSNVWSFDPGLDVFVREVLQNARDAAPSTSSREPVRVRFRLITLAGDDLEAYRAAVKWADLESHLKASASGKQKFNTLLADGLRRVEKDDELVLMLVEDEGTTGLTGPETGSGAFTALCRNNLDSNKGTDAGAGGAFGLGKAVLWRASRLSTVLFNSNLKTPEGGKDRNRLFGRCELAWHKNDGGDEFAGPGWFGDVQGGGETAVSYWGNEELADALYLGREQTGTTACVLGFHDASDDVDRPPSTLAREIVEHAAINFFPAIVAGKLEVTVEVYDSGRDFRSGRPALTQTVNPSDHLPAEVRMLTKFRDGETVKKLGDGTNEVAFVDVPLMVPRRIGEPIHNEQTHPAVLLVTPADDEEGGEEKNRQYRLAVFRGPGMVVFDESLQAACLGAQPFHALLLCGKAAAEIAPEVTRATSVADAAAEQFLRVAEPPSHDKWTSTPDLKALYARGCVTKLTEFLKAAKRAVSELVKPIPKDTGDGPDSLKELFQIGSEPRPRVDQPRVIPGECFVDDEGQWCVEARIRMKPKKSTQRLFPAVYFMAETGTGIPVRWSSLTGTRDCQSEGQSLVVPSGIRELRFRGVTDATGHPIPASDSCIVVDVKKSVEIAEVVK